MGGGSGRARGKLGLVLLTLLLAARALGDSTALVLIDPSRAGPFVDPTTYVHENWVLWPAAVGSGSNRILSLLSGLDWAVADRDLASVGTGTAGVFQLVGWTRLGSIGYRQACMVATGGPTTELRADSTGNTARGAILLAAQPNSSVVAAIPLTVPFGRDTLTICQADNWNDVVAVASHVPRCLVVEYPPSEHASWTRFWLRGDWPKGMPVSSTGIPGLLPAREVGATLQHPNYVTWRVDDAGAWGGANRWLERARDSTYEILIAIGMLLGYVMVCAAYLIAQERRGDLARLLFSFLLLAPGAFLLEGRIAPWVGSESAWLSFGLAWTSLSTLALLARMVGGKHGLAPLSAVAIAGLVGCLTGNPTWSLMNPVWYGSLAPLPVWGTAALLMYVALACAYPPAGKVRSAGIALIAGLVLAGLFGGWAGGIVTIALSPIVLLLGSFGWLKPVVLAAFVVFPSSIAGIAMHGVSYTPDGLVRSLNEAHAIRFDAAVDLLTSPVVLLTLLFVVVMAAIGGRFLWRQTRRALLGSSGEQGLLHSTAAICALAILEPRLVPTALLLLLASTIVLMVEALANA